MLFRRQERFALLYPTTLLVFHNDGSISTFTSPLDEAKTLQFDSSPVSSGVDTWALMSADLWLQIQKIIIFQIFQAFVLCSFI